MEFSFEIMGISAIRSFVDYQYEARQQPQQGAEYLGLYQCTLEAFIAAIQLIEYQRGWQLEKVIEAITRFWFNNDEQIAYWQSRLQEAGDDQLLVVKISDFEALRAKFELLLGYGQTWR
jgi:plasmid maintenance system antidote protein VapI